MERENKMALWALGMAGKYILVFLAFVLYTLILARGVEAKAAKKYEAWQTRFADEYTAQQTARAEAIKAGAPRDPYDVQLETEAKALSKVLYGIRDNSTDDLRTLCWCVFNRVDSPDYADTLEEVIAQPQQWMRYSEDSPVLDSLYQIARAELDAWHTGTTRPCAADFVYMQWTPSEIVLRNTWVNSSHTRYWRIKE